MPNINLRDYQEQVIKDIYGKFKQGKRRVLCFAPTGAGKSILITRIVSDALKRHKRTLIVVHRSKLALQLKATIEHFTGISASMIMPGGKFDDLNPIQIAMAQTLENRELPSDIDILLGDETHVTSYFKIWTKCLDAYCGKIWAFSKCFVVGFTATPWRTKRDEGYCHLFDSQVKAPSPRKLISMGYLTHPRLFVYDMIDPSQLKATSDGDYTVSSLARVCNHEFNEDVVSKWKELCPERKTIVFCASVRQAKHMTKTFQESGQNVELITGSDGSKKRDEVFKRFKSGETHVLVSVSTLCEGFDETSIGCVIVARPTRSPALLIQMIGRGLRLHDGKEDVIIMDCGDCIPKLIEGNLKGRRIEDPIDLDYVRLCPVKKGKMPDEKKECPECGKMIFKMAKFCPHCEYEFESAPKAKPDLVVFPELEEFITKAQVEQFKWIRKEMLKMWQNNGGPLRMFAKHANKFGILPTQVYFKGAIFGKQFSAHNAYVYRKYLEGKVPGARIKFFMDLEFGKEPYVPVEEPDPKQMHPLAADWWIKHSNKK